MKFHIPTSPVNIFHLGEQSHTSLPQNVGTFVPEISRPFIAPVHVGWRPISQMEDIIGNCVICLNAERWDFVKKTNEFALDLAVIFMCPVHRALDIEVELPHQDRYNVSANLADGLFNVV